MTGYMIHPGGKLAHDLRDRFDVGPDEAADLLEEPRSALSGVFRGERRLSPDLPLKIEAVFGANAEVLVQMQAEYDLWVAKHEPDVMWKVARLRRISARP